ncbi:nucleotidyltransferase domain-containing protein [Abyssalbus ytuae]|uniref:Nucleotidyltransferase domain-containing protein n=1 Tax=Abyssalbus ytuae TaxID=2926907 RepID=A0A9E7CSH0_9FLAO|nr:nucleotidyltransferase domain-containing protein [Abyssalbus ytuae]UOB16271.1 nucleotidyltransferase domain-containing protein [Abyssalbus ytuae]
MKQQLSHLPPDKIKELETVTQRIVATGKAEMVILFGSYARGDYKEQRGKAQGKQSDYDILVVTANADTRQGLRKKLRGIFKDIGIPVQLIVEKIGFVNSNLEEKQYFFTDIKREGKVLYNSGNFQLSDPKELTPTRRREIAEEDCKYWFGMAKKVQNSIRKDERLASFDYQQVVEMCYTAIEMVFTHYNPYEHNLEVLQNRVLKFDTRVKEAFPRATEEQKELFDHLNYAYIGGRYKSEEEFPVTRQQLNYWEIETKKLLDLTEQICLEHIEALKAIEKAGTT